MNSFFSERIDFDDLIFESRNKEYGAYILRRRYNLKVIISIIIASSIFIAFIVFPYLQALSKSHDAGREIRPRYVEVKMEKMEPPKEEIIIPPAPDPPPPNTITNIKYVAPVVLPAEKPQPTVDEVLASNPANEQLLVAGRGNSDELITGQEGDSSDEAFITVEIRPTFKGGDIEKFRDWVQKRTNYPQIAQDNGIQGKVILTFVVEKDGSVSNVRVVKSVDKILDDEAVKAIMASPKWSPGLQMGRPVRVRFYIPLVFSFNR
jgi:protein TonB